MHASDIIAWHVNGCVVCPDCATDDVRNSEEACAVFADDIGDETGATCHDCRSCLMPDGDWYPHDDATGPTVRWSTCTRCNAQRPWLKADGDYRSARLAALRGGAQCHDCGRNTVRF